MSCGRLALERAGIPVANYYAAEIDKHAIKVALDNYPDTVQLGDVTKVKIADLPFVPDLIIGGSPCQGFSFAGKQLAFDDPRSKLFFEFVRLVNEARMLNPNVKFMLENVKMKREFIAVISRYLGVKPVVINSSLVSAQNRVRYYWANFPITQPEDRGIFLRDILEDADTIDGFYTPREGAPADGSICKAVGLAHGAGHEMPRRVYDPIGKSPTLTAQPRGGAYPPKITQVGLIKNRGEFQLRDKKSMCLDANYHKGADNHGQRTIIGVAVAENGNLRPYKNDGHMGSLSEIGTIVHPDNKAMTLVTTHPPSVLVKCGRIVNRRINPETGKRDDYNTDLPLEPRVEPRADDKTGCLTTVAKDNVLVQGDIVYRKLTPVECERLQTVPDGYTGGVSNTQRYRMLGNGWTIEVIAHIFGGLRHVWGFDLA